MDKNNFKITTTNNYKDDDVLHADIDMNAVARDGLARMSGFDNRNEFQKKRDAMESDKYTQKCDETMDEIKKCWRKKGWY